MRPRAAVAVSSAISMLGALPAFLLGALAVLVREELGFSETRLGIAIASFFVAAAAGSVACGRLSQRLGETGSVLSASALATLALGGAATAVSWPQLVAWMLVGGLSNAFAQVAGNLVLAGAVRPGRQGLAFGIKQSALPAATLVSGAGVPLLGVTLGWRWVYAVTAVMALALGLLHLWRGQRTAPVRLPRPRRGGAGSPAFDRRPLVLLGLAAVFMAAATMSMASFLVEFGVSVGLTPGAAGTVLAAGSTVGIVFRIALGWLTDRRLHHDLAIVGGGLAAGSIVLAGLPAAQGVAGMTLGAVLAFTVGWGWPGVFNLAVVRRYPAVPAIATSFTQVGVYVGSMIGPLTFGIVVERLSYTVAWRMTGASLALASALILLARRRTDRRPPAG